MTEDTKSWFDCFFGSESQLNVFGKIVLSPLILAIGVIFMACDFLFVKRTP